MGSKPSSLNQMFGCGSKKKKTPVEETYFHHELDLVLAQKEEKDSSCTSQATQERNPSSHDNALSEKSIRKQQNEEGIEKIRKFEEPIFDRAKNFDYDEFYFKKEQLEYYSKLLQIEKRNRKNSEEVQDFKNLEWREGRPLGQGSYGLVYEAFDLHTNKTMAVKKVFLGYQARDKDVSTNILVLDLKTRIEALETEIQFLKMLQHPNIVKYYGCQKTEKSFNIFLEYVEQGSLCSVIEEYGKLEEQVVKVYIKKILKGLEYLHYHNVIHRDIKAANVLVNVEGVCKLADFGTAKEVLKKDKSNSLKGTPCWMAPEVIKELPYGRQIDIWSIGCLAIELLSGTHPWANKNSTYEILYTLMNTQEIPQIPDDISSDCKDFIMSCLNRDPLKRLNVYELLKHPFMVQNNSDIIREVQLQKELENKLLKKNSNKASVNFQNYLNGFIKQKNNSQKNQSLRDRKLSFQFKNGYPPRDKFQRPGKRTEIRLQLPRRIDDDFDQYSSGSNLNSGSGKIKLEINQDNKQLLLILKNKKKTQQGQYSTPQTQNVVQISDNSLNLNEEEEEPSKVVNKRSSDIMNGDESMDAGSEKTIKKAPPRPKRSRKISETFEKLKITNQGSRDMKIPRLRIPKSNDIKIRDEKVFVSYDGNTNEMLVRVDEFEDEPNSGKYDHFHRENSKKQKFTKKAQEEQIQFDTESASSQNRNASLRDEFSSSKKSTFTSNSVFSNKSKPPSAPVQEYTNLVENQEREQQRKAPRLKKIKLSKKYQSQNSKDQAASECWTSDSKQKKINFFQENLDQNTTSFEPQLQANIETKPRIIGGPYFGSRSFIPEQNSGQNQPILAQEFV